MKNDKNDLIQIKVANYAIEDNLQDFKPKFTILNKIIYVTVTLISPVTITHKQKSFNQPK